MNRQQFLLTKPCDVCNVEMAVIKMYVKINRGEGNHTNGHKNCLLRVDDYGKIRPLREVTLSTRIPRYGQGKHWKITTNFVHDPIAIVDAQGVEVVSFRKVHNMNTELLGIFQNIVDKHNALVKDKL